MNRKAWVYYKDIKAGVVEQLEEMYQFYYLAEYLERKNAAPVSLTMPLQKEPYITKDLHPFFDGLIPEGWLLDVAHETWKVSRTDRMGILLIACQDCIGAVSIIDATQRELV
jgi:serine/threonine-protein kinase HipA